MSLFSFFFFNIIQDEYEEWPRREQQQKSFQPSPLEELLTELGKSQLSESDLMFWQ